MLGSLIKRERIMQNMSQEALCEGICAPSYLSKIENEQVGCSDEICQLLFEALNINFVTDEELIAAFDSLHEEWGQAYFFMKPEELSKLETQLEELCEKLIYSSRSVDVALLQLILGGKIPTQEELDRLSPFVGKFTAEQEVYYLRASSEKLKKEGRLLEATQCLERIKIPSRPYIYEEYGYLHFKLGNYLQAITACEEAYHSYAKQGFVTSMLNAATTISACYYCLYQMHNAVSWVNTAQNINKLVGNIWVEFALEYNEGTTQIEYRNYKKADQILTRAEEIATREDLDEKCWFMLFQKKAINYTLLHEREKAENYLLKMKNISDDEVSKASFALIRYMLDTPNYQEEKTYAELLEVCVEEAKKKNHQGKADFFLRFLLDAYKSTRQYKKALELTEYCYFPEMEE